MSLFSPIRHTAQIPQFAREGIALDVKARLDPKDEELAKDVAAFANSAGGTLMHNVAERAGGRFHYLPMSETEANNARSRYEVAVRDHCSPAPLLECMVIRVDGGFLTTINVWPFPTQPVGVSIGVGKRTPKASFAFPLRVASHTEWLMPEQLSMFMVPELRRIAILCSQIGPSDAVHVTMSRMPRAINALFVEVDQLGSSLRLTLEGYRVCIPLDAVRLVWKDESIGWRLDIRGQVHGTQYVPLSDAGG